MNKLTIHIISSFVFVVTIQICYTATIEDAQAVLDELRETTNKHLNAAYLNHTKMSNEVDYASIWAKEHGLSEIEKKGEKFLAKLKVEKSTTHRCRGSRQNAIKHLEKMNSEELLLCIEAQANDSVNYIFKMKISLADYVSTAIYDEEKNIIACGQFDEDCLERVIADIRDKINSVADVIQDELAVSKYTTEEQLDLVKECAYQSIAKAQLSLEKLSTCVY